MRDHVFFAAGVFDVRLQETEVKQINYAQAAAASFVLVARANPARSGPNFYAAGRVFRRELNHAVVGKNDVRAVADKQIAIYSDPSFAQRGHFLQKRNWIEHHSVSNYATTALAQHPTGHQLQDKSLAINDDRVAGIVASGVTRHDGEVLGEHVNNLALALVAPLSADHDGGLTLLQCN